MRGGYKNQRIFCQAKNKFGKPCGAKGYFVPTLREYRCPWHGAINSYNYHTRKYRNIFTKNDMSIDKKVNKLKNLKNFKDKSTDEIKKYIKDQQQKAITDKRYRSKYYTRNYLRWRNTSYRNQRHTKDQLDEFLQVFRSKSKV